MKAPGSFFHFVKTHPRIDANRDRNDKKVARIQIDTHQITIWCNVLEAQAKAHLTKGKRNTKVRRCSPLDVFCIK